MRCQRVRSYLSAYCSGELEGRLQLRVREHLSACAGCRREVRLYESLNQGSRELPEVTVSDGFNNQLLNRIAEERFAETRTRAFLPQRAPAMAWGKVVPAVVSAFAIVVVAVGLMLGGSNDSNLGLAQNGAALSNDYLTAQPTNNPNVTDNMHRNWSFDQQLAKAERFRSLSNRVANQADFTGQLVGARSQTVGVPYQQQFHRLQQVTRVYMHPTEMNHGEDARTY